MVVQSRSGCERRLTTAVLKQEARDIIETLSTEITKFDHLLGDGQPVRSGIAEELLVDGVM